MQAMADANGVFDPLERLIEEIHAARSSNMHSVALMSTMALIDICGALSARDGRSTGPGFKAWFEANVAGHTAKLDPADAWLLRCGLLHQGHARGNGYDHILFTLPGGNVRMHGNIVSVGGRDALNLDLRFFIDDVLGAVERWWLSSKKSEPVATNAEQLARIRSNGFSPFIAGVLIIG